MRFRTAACLVALTLLGAGCASSGTDTPSPTGATEPPGTTETSGTSATDSTSPDGGGTQGSTSSTQAPSATSPPPDGKPAPDFTLPLGETGESVFMLSQEVKPVFMVFWAEW